MNCIKINAGVISVPCIGNNKTEMKLLRIETSLDQSELSIWLRRWLLEFLLERPELVVLDKVYISDEFEFQTRLETRASCSPNANDFVREFVKFLNYVKEPIWVRTDDIELDQISKAYLSKDRDLYLRVVMARRNKFFVAL
jgi:hypothetical protein